VVPCPVGAEAPQRAKGFVFVVDTTQSKEFALAHWLVNGADGGRLFVPCFGGGDGTVRENAAGDVLASLTTMVWNAPSKSWTGGPTIADASLNRRMTVRLGDAVAFAQIGGAALDGQIELEALRLYGLRRRRHCSAAPLPRRPGGQGGPARQPLPRQAAAGAEDDAAVALMMAVGRAMAEDTNEGDLTDFLGATPSSLGRPARMEAVGMAEGVRGAHLRLPAAPGQKATPRAARAPRPHGGPAASRCGID
jgi:hypothetical protein